MGQILTHILIEFIAALGPDLGLSSGLGYDMSASTNEMALLFLDDHSKMAQVCSACNC